MAQAVERILGKDEVGGSSPPISSMIKSPFSVCSGGGDFYFALTRLAKSNPEYAALQNDYEAQQKILAMFNKALGGSMESNSNLKNNVKYSIVELDNGHSYVRADRKIITGNTVAEMRKDITGFFNKILKNGDLIVTTSDGNKLTINKKTTAKKARDNYISIKGKRVKLSEDAFRVKLNAESHVDELAETSHLDHSDLDKKDHSFARNRFDYYKTYFQDFDGVYYEITLSVGVADEIATVYNVGRITKDDLPSAKIIAVRGSKALGKSSNTSISTSDENVKFSLKEPAEETKDLIAVHNITAANMHKALDLGGFDEIAYVVIPDNADDGLKSALSRNGIEYREYESGNEQSRVDVFNSLDDVKFSRKESADYSYDTLVSKPDMAVTNITDGINYRAQGITRKDIVNDAVNNAKNVGRENENGNAVIYVDDIGTDIIVPKKAIQHSLDRRIEVNGPVVTNIGNILKNSIKINELIPRSDNIEQSYVLIGAAKNQQNEPFIVSFVVNEFTNEVKSIDVLYSVNAKKEPAGSLSPQLSTAATDSNISISDLLDYVNRYYPDILPEDVLKHYGYTVRPSGVIGENALYSLKEEDDSSIFEDNDELNDAAESLQEMLRYVSAENNELRSAFDIKTDSLCKKQSIKSVGTNKSARLRVGAAISRPYSRLPVTLRVLPVRISHYIKKQSPQKR